MAGGKGGNGGAERDASDRARRDCGAGLRRSTPHLTSPLKGGRDELGKRVGVDSVGYPRRARVPACAGMTEGAWV